MQGNRSILVFAVALAAASAAVILHSACLVESRCVSDTDCPYPQRCGADGQCGLECSASQPDSCPSDRPQCLVAEQRCVECLEPEDCGDDEECISYSCSPAEAPDFTLTDTNPASETLGQTVTLSGLRGQVVLLFFAGLG
jgi:hypothetical protein